ncbi:hypothetical protein ITZ39_004598 [Escherichia coli]|nr:hypothetical protein [Escherichia coli]EGO4099501.1 hypothetical protein [Escherichia coli]EGO4183805.1 hypothetical protein [Escherichia coli]HBA3922590.1 hypothetical protein [Escherichia coli]
MNTYSITLPWPPSNNRYYRHNRGRTHISAEGQAYRDNVARIIKNAMLDMVKNPELTAKKEQESEMSSTGAMLGLDPSSRQRLIGLAGKKKATNPFLKIIES